MSAEIVARDHAPAGLELRPLDEDPIPVDEFSAAGRTGPAAFKFTETIYENFPSHRRRLPSLSPRLLWLLDAN